MKIDKQFILRNLITILCVLCIVALFFAFITTSVKIESSFVGSNTQSTSISGWQAVNGFPLGWLLVIGPVLLVAMNYIRKIEKYKGLLAILVPILCIAVLFFTLADAKSTAELGNKAMENINGIANSALADMDDYDDEYGGEYGGDYSAGQISSKVSASAAVGFYLLLLANFGIIVSGAVTFFGLRLNDLSSVKESGRAILSSAREAAAELKTENGASAPAGQNAPAARVRSGGRYKAEDALQLIERMAKMRDDGILTEDEFQEKKQDLLKGI